MLAHPQPCVCSHPSLWRAGWDWSLLRWGWDASPAKLCPALSRDALHLDEDELQVKSLPILPVPEMLNRLSQCSSFLLPAALKPQTNPNSCKNLLPFFSLFIFILFFAILTTSCQKSAQEVVAQPECRGSCFRAFGIDKQKVLISGKKKCGELALEIQPVFLLW